MLSMGGLCAGSPEAKVLVAFFVLLLEGSFGITVMVIARGNRLIPFSFDRCSSCVLGMDHNGN